ncbi:hypothetical protein J2X83_005800 [Brevibacillus nitrificans]|nr:hypothetical protein [Brevibacillus nitrificans]
MGIKIQPCNSKLSILEAKFYAGEFVHLAGGCILPKYKYTRGY